MNKENMHTCIRALMLNSGKGQEATYREGISYERLDNGVEINMRADDGIYHAVSPDVYEEHFLFDSDADIERLRTEEAIEDFSFKKITIKEFAEMAMSLKPHASIKFQHFDEDSNIMEYFITLLSLSDSDCLVANCVGGGHPLVIDVTTYDIGLESIYSELDQYIISAAGNYGFVHVLECTEQYLRKRASIAASAGGCILISVTERDIEAAFFPSYKEAYAQMETELEETMVSGRESVTADQDYGIYELSAWSNANHNAHSDWRIVKLSNIGLARPCIHLEWSRLEDIACEKLSLCAERGINANYIRSEPYCWGLNIAGTPLNKNEIERLFAEYGADDFDRESNDIGEYPIMEINQGLAEKLMASELPFVLDRSLADNLGVWFFGAPCGEQVTVLVRYPEADMEPDIVRFSLNETTTKKELITCINRTVAGIRRRKTENDDRLSLLNFFMSHVTEKTGCIASVLYTDIEVEIM
jgi:hypothetical protein